MEKKQLTQLSRNFERRLKSMLLRSGIARALILGLGILPVFLLLDWWLHLASGWRVLTLLIYLGGLGATAWWTMIKPLRHAWSDKETLGYIDSVMPRDQGMLLDLYELLDGNEIQETERPVGKSLSSGAVENLSPIAGKVKAGEFVEKKRLNRWLKILGAVAGVFIIVSIPLAEYVGIGCVRFFNPFSGMRWPHRTTIALEEPEKGWTIPQMESFEVKGRITGVKPPEVTMAYKDQTAGYWIKEKVMVRQKAGEEYASFSYTFPEVREKIRFYVEGGDYKTHTRNIEIIQRPYLKKITAHYDYPDYAGIPNKTVESGQLSGIEGTSVRLVFECSMDLEKALLKFNDEEPEILTMKSPKEFEKTIMLRENGQYAVELYEKHGYRETKPEVYDIQVFPDNPPEVEILQPGRDMVATKKATVDFSFTASDDFGLQSVKVMYRIDDGEPKVLSDKITGPVSQRGKKSAASFSWALRKMDLPDSGLLQYYVSIQDINPTGRGKVDSARFRIKLVKPSQFHLEAIERAKRLDTEARIAWENQLKAWDKSKEWLKKGTGNENDPIWTEMVDKQSMSKRAARAMKMLLQDLTSKYKQNNMSREFMSVRLNMIAESLSNVTDELHPEIVNGIDSAKPKTAAEAAPPALKAKRAAQLRKFGDRQKLAVLYMERVLEKLFDWRDLQITTVRSTLLHEEQEEVLKLTEQIAPKFIGLEIEDVSDDDQKALVTLGKRQRTVFNVETELEEQLVYLKFKARKQKRKSIQKPLDTAYKVLRDPAYRVNDNLKMAARKIANNQPDQIIKNQKTALHALDIVKGGLILAGQNVDKDQDIVLAMKPNRDLGTIETSQKLAKADEKPEAASDTPAGGAREQSLTPEEMLKALPMGSDVLSTAINMAWELQDSVRARTKYLNNNMGKEEMPRYVMLKQAILDKRQGDALKAVDLAVKEAEKAEKKEEVMGAGRISKTLGSVKREFDQSRRLIGKRILGEGALQLQKDSMQTLRDLTAYVALEKQIKDAVDENKKRGGEDAFGRKFVVRSNDLDRVIGIMNDMNQARLLQGDLLRKVNRFANQPAKEGLLKEIEQENMKRASSQGEQLKKLISTIKPRVEKLSEDVAPMIKEAGVEAVLSMQIPEPGSATGAEASMPHKTNLNMLAQAIQSLQGLLGETVKTRMEIAEDKPMEFEEISAEEFERRQSEDFLANKLEAASDLPPEIRDIMLKALKKGFPEKYKKLIAAYYSSFIKEEAVR